MSAIWKSRFRKLQQGGRSYAAGMELAVRSAIDRRRVGDTPFSVIANDCWGGEVYKHLRRAFNTPFIGLFEHGPCFVRLLDNLDDDLSGQLRFVTASRYGTFEYPVARVASGAEIHFLHYGSQSEAREKWTRRCARIDFEHVRVKFSDGKDATTSLEVSQVLKLRPEALVFFWP